MHILSVNIGRPQTITYGAEKQKTAVTGIYKLPAAAPVRIGRYGLAGDAVTDEKNHGGLDQAVYIYGVEDYAWWSRELGWACAPGLFGENLTIAGLASADYSVGDRLQTGAAMLEVTAPRIPCHIFAARLGDPAFVKRFRAAERPGLYCRVLIEGDVVAGDPVVWQPFAGTTVSIVEMFRGFYQGKDQEEASIRRHLAAPIAERARAEQEERLRALLDRRTARPHQ